MRRPPSTRYPMSSPSSRISPASNCSSRSTQRSSVVLPEPLAPISDTTSPARTSRSTPCSTLWTPKLLVRSLMVRIGSKLSQPVAPLEPRAAGCDEEIDSEIEPAGKSIELHRLEGTSDDLLGGQQKLADPDRRQERRRLDDFHRCVDEIGCDLANCLRHQHIAERLRKGQADGAGGIGLRQRNGKESAAERLAD